MKDRSRGAAAVEFALVVPVIIILVLGMIEFGYLIFLNSSAAGAAREGARAAAISGTTADGASTAISVFSSTTGRTATASVLPSSAACTTDQPVIVTVSASYGTLTRFFGAQFTATGKGEMRCGG